MHRFRAPPCPRSSPALIAGRHNSQSRHIETSAATAQRTWHPYLRDRALRDGSITFCSANGACLLRGAGTPSQCTAGWRLKQARHAAAMSLRSSRWISSRPQLGRRLTLNRCRNYYSWLQKGPRPKKIRVARVAPSANNTAPRSSTQAHRHAGKEVCPRAPELIADIAQQALVFSLARPHAIGAARTRPINLCACGW